MNAAKGLPWVRSDNNRKNFSFISPSSSCRTAGSLGLVPSLWWLRHDACLCALSGAMSALWHAPLLPLLAVVLWAQHCCQDVPRAPVWAFWLCTCICGQDYMIRGAPCKMKMHTFCLKKINKNFKMAKQNTKPSARPLEAHHSHAHEAALSGLRSHS